MGGGEKAVSKILTQEGRKERRDARNTHILLKRDPPTYHPTRSHDGVRESEGWWRRVQWWWAMARVGGSEGDDDGEVRQGLEEGRLGERYWDGREVS